MNIEDVIDYVLDSPGNTNPNVLRTKLQQLIKEEGGSGMVIIPVTDDNGAIDADLTPAQLNSYIDAKQSILLKVTNEASPDRINYYPFTTYLANPSERQWFIRFGNNQSLGASSLDEEFHYWPE